MKTRTRNLTVIGVAASTVLAIAGCGTAESTTTAPGRTTGPGTTPVVALVLPGTEQNFAREMGAGFTAGVQQVGGVEAVVKGTSRMDTSGEAKILDDLIKSKGAAGISLFMQAASVFAPLIADARAQGIPMIAIDNKFDETTKVPLFIGNDNYALGRSLAEEVVGKLGPDATGDIVLGTPVPGIPVLDMRVQGMRDVFRDRLPKVSVLGPFDTKTDPLVNLGVWQNLVTANPDALAFLGAGDADGPNLSSIRKNTKGTWLAGAYNLDPRALEAVKAGDLLLVSPEHFTKGLLSGRLLAQQVKDGKPLPEGWIYTPGLAITPANIDEIIERQQSEAAKKAWFTPLADKILADPKTYLRPLAEAR